MSFSAVVAVPKHSWLRQRNYERSVGTLSNRFGWKCELDRMESKVDEKSFEGFAKLKAVII